MKSKYILIKDNKDLLNKIPNDEVRTRYETYEIEYLKGYNRGDAHFVSMSKGNYILRLKSETINKDAKYVINYCSDDCNINIEEILNMTNDDKVDMLRDAFVSIMHKSPRVFPNREERQEILAFGNTFEEIGYCYIAVKCLKKAKNEILVEVDPEYIMFNVENLPRMAMF